MQATAYGWCGGNFWFRGLVVLPEAFRLRFAGSHEDQNACNERFILNRNRMRRKTQIIATVSVLCILAGEVAYWRIVAERLRAGYEAWLAGLTAQGWTALSGAPSIGGWPAAATLAVPDLSIRHGGAAVPGDLEVAAAGVTLSVSLFNPGALRISMSGPGHVRVAHREDMIVTGEAAWVSVPLVDTATRAIELHASGVRIEPASGAWHATAGLLNGNATIAEATPADQAEPAARFSVNAEAIALPGVVKWPLGTNISSVSLDGVLNGPLPPAGDVTAWAEAWRDGGGSLAITHLTLGWGPLGLTSSATLALDDQLQPMGSGTGRIIGYAATLDRLAAAGTLTKSAATAAKAVLSLMAGTADGDEPSAVDVPLTLQYRTLSMRQVPLVRLPELDWPAR